MGTLHKMPGHGRAPGGAAQAPPAKPQLQPLARLDVEQARQFLADLGYRTAGADIPEAMFLLGRLAEQAMALLDVIDATVTP
ncbi:MAG TPA: hypothetical protein VIJ82_21990 [Streptosporangiaceae bacterium]|jgi:hypothetical protein